VPASGITTVEIPHGYHGELNIGYGRWIRVLKVGMSCCRRILVLERSGGIDAAFWCGGTAHPRVVVAGIPGWNGGFKVPTK
jgi:phytoene dehydrogenase-like protein